ncbi:tetratricopeptide repeat protein [Elioraea thermophila]|uniref:tetratricopeptide repeat protein n=1 Tax=Elioraea thermophila TaxID=2185104 RepID=UPI000DF1C465|nr:tetratricopeptide repeat protein [Elioraea thermophila]
MRLVAVVLLAVLALRVEAASLLERGDPPLPGPLAEVIALIEEGRFGEAELRLAVLRAAAPRDPALALAAAEIAARRGDAARAESELRAGLAAAPDATALWRALGRLKALAGDAEAMDQAFRAAIAARPDERANPLEAAELWHERFGRPDRALPHYERAAAITPDDAWLLWRYGLALARAGRTAEAIAMLERAADADPTSPLPDHARGGLLAELGRPAEAIAAYDRALARRADHTETRLARAALVLSQGRTGEAIAEFDRAARERPDIPQPWVGLGMALERAGNIQGAVLAYRRALERHAEDPIALNNLAWLIALGAGEPAEAVALARRAAALLPDDPSVLTTLGEALRRSGEAREAEAQFDRAIGIEPTAERHYRRALAREALGDRAGALADLDRALVLDPRHALARADRGRLQP